MKQSYNRYLYKYKKKIIKRAKVEMHTKYNKNYNEQEFGLLVLATCKPKTTHIAVAARGQLNYIIPPSRHK